MSKTGKNEQKESSWVPISKMNRTQCDRLSRILQNSNADKFMAAFNRLFPGTSISIAWSTYSHRRHHMDQVKDRVKELDAEARKITPKKPGKGRGFVRDLKIIVGAQRLSGGKYNYPVIRLPKEYGRFIGSVVKPTVGHDKLTLEIPLLKS